MESRRLRSVARDTVRVSCEHDVTFMAGGIAHAAFLSILPLLLLLFVVGAVVNVVVGGRHEVRKTVDAPRRQTD